MSLEGGTQAARTALMSGRAALADMDVVVEHLEKAGRAARGHLVLEPFGLLKYYHLYAARRRMRRARAAFDTFQADLAVLGRSHNAGEANVGAGEAAALGDLVTEVFGGGLLVLSRIERTRIRANVARSRVRKVVRQLEQVIAHDTAEPE